MNMICSNSHVCGERSTDLGFQFFTEMSGVLVSHDYARNKIRIDSTMNNGAGNKIQIYRPTDKRRPRPSKRKRGALENELKKKRRYHETPSAVGIEI